MTRRLPNELRDKGMIDAEQFQRIDLIHSGRLISVFYELRTLLYLGILLFSTGAGILIYKNINDLGHLIALAGLCVLTACCFFYIFRYATPYTHSKVTPPTPFYDYIVLLAALLFISILGYLEFLYNFLEAWPEVASLVAAAVFFYIAYRFDHVGVLSLAITSLASFWSISVTPGKWYYGDFGNFSELYNTAIIFSTALGLIALALDKKHIKTHFTFTYLNFCALIFFVGSISGVFIDEWYGIYLLLIYGGCIFAYYMARWKRSFLFLLYAFLSAYIGTTYLLADTIFDDKPEAWFTYSILSCGGFIYFIIRFKNHFKQPA